MKKYHVIVVGSGMAGMITAWQLNRLGYKVTICTQSTISKHGLQTLHNSILETFSFLELDDIFKAMFLTPVIPNIIWGKEKVDSQYKEKSYLVYRQALDKALLNKLKSCDIKIIEQAQGFNFKHLQQQWSVINKSNNQILTADFIVNATGKHITNFDNLNKNGCKTLALHFSWSDNTLSNKLSSTYVASGNHYWCWGANLNTAFNLVIFIDPKTLSNQYHGQTSELLKFVISQQGWLENWPTQQPCKETAMDASAYYCNKAIDDNLIHVGDAVLKIDPLSSQGIQSAIATATQAAICINTILQHPQNTHFAKQFYQQRIDQRAASLAQFSQQSYHQLASVYHSNFWLKRSQKVTTIYKKPPANQKQILNLNSNYQCSHDYKKTAPYIKGDFIQTCEAIEHPLLANPVLFLKNGLLWHILSSLENKTINEISEIVHLSTSQKNELFSILELLLNIGVLHSLD